MSSFGPFTGQLGSTFFITEAELPSVKQGCRVATSEISGSLECLCGVGCHKEFPFKTRTECEASLKGEYYGNTGCGVSNWGYKIRKVFA